MRIDAYAHLLPVALERHVAGLEEFSSPSFDSWRRTAGLTAVESRLAMLDRFEIDRQVVMLPPPPLDSLLEGAALAETVRIANDSLAEVCAGSDRLLAVGYLPLAEPELAVRELERIQGELGMVGGMVFSHARGRPLDHPQVVPVLSRAAEMGLPLWLHPERSVRRPDYPTEEVSRYGLNLLLGWPHETTVAICRLVLSKVMQDNPGLEIVTHHGGGTLPMLAGRIEANLPEGEDLPRVGEIADLKRPLVEQFRRFHGDTVLGGSDEALRATHDFFGSERVIFATDMPFGTEDGAEYIRSAVESLERLEIPSEQKDRIWAGNLIKLIEGRPRAESTSSRRMQVNI